MEGTQSTSTCKQKTGTSTNANAESTCIEDNSEFEEETLQCTSNTNAATTSSYRESLGSLETIDNYDDLPDGAKFAEEGPSRTPLFVKTVPQDVCYTGHHTLDTTPSYMWRTPLKDTVVIGSSKSLQASTGPTIWVVDDKFNITTHNLTIGEMLLTGECINTELSIVHVLSAKDDPPYTVFTARIDVCSNIATSITPVGILEVGEHPQIVFRFSKNKFGVLCGAPSRIEIFTLITLLTGKQIKPAETILLDVPDFNVILCSPRVCITPDSHICVSFCDANCIVLFNDAGERLSICNLFRAYHDPLNGCGSYYPRSVQYGEDGRLFVSGHGGDLHLFYGQNWKLVKDNGPHILHSLVTETRMWTLGETNVTLYSFSGETIVDKKNN